MSVKADASKDNQTAPFKILKSLAAESYPSVCTSLSALTAPPGSLFSNIYWWSGIHGIVDSAPGFPPNDVVPVWFNVVPTMPTCW